ncbi:MAG: hypothetical protein K2M45_05740 [Muribaculaceae bacterium]|nr:hypothetical protein [Muribaculaceae bacterium]
MSFPKSIVSDKEVLPAYSGNVVGVEFVNYSRSLAAMREVQAGLDYR